MTDRTSNERLARHWIGVVGPPLHPEQCHAVIDFAKWLDGQRSQGETTAVTRDTPIVREIFERHDRCSKLLWGPASLPGMMLGPMDADAAHSDRGRLLSLIPAGSPPKTGEES